MIALLALALAANQASSSPDAQAAAAAAQAVAALDTEYQAAVKKNDAPAMERILHPDMVLVGSRGQVTTRAELLQGAREKSEIYEIQDEEPGTQKVRLFGAETAVVTARLRLKGRHDIKGPYDPARMKFDYRVWFSDTYVRTREGWKYVFGQASLQLTE